MAWENFEFFCNGNLELFNDFKELLLILFFNEDLKI